MFSSPRGLPIIHTCTQKGKSPFLEVIAPDRCIVSLEKQLQLFIHRRDIGPLGIEASIYEDKIKGLSSRSLKSLFINEFSSLFCLR